MAFVTDDPNEAADRLCEVVEGNAWCALFEITRSLGLSEDIWFGIMRPFLNTPGCHGLQANTKAIFATRDFLRRYKTRELCNALKENDDDSSR